MSDLTVVFVNAGTSSESSTSRLLNLVADALREQASRNGDTVTLKAITLKELAPAISSTLVSGIMAEQVQDAGKLLASADAVVAGSPIYKAEASGLFAEFWHVMDRDVLIGKPVLLAATAGTARHSLVVDHQMRSLFAYMRALVVPTALFAAETDWNSSKLNERVKRAADELYVLAQFNFRAHLGSDTQNAYQRDFGGAGGTDFDVNFDSDLMKLAIGQPTS